MSTAVAVNRPPSDVSSPSQSVYRIANRCSTSASSPTEPASISPPVVKPVEIEELEIRIERALRDRDDQWRRHEKAQIQFLQNETANMLKSLHVEINRLSNELREAKRRAVMGGNDEDEEENLKKIEELEKQLFEKETYTKNLEKKVSATIQKLQEQINIQSDRIRQLNDELNDRNQTVAHLSQQLRTIRLRDAMATSQHRRRASQQTSPPVTSPSSPHRIFPPISSGIVSASVAVTYPGNLSSRSASQINTRRANSAMRAPSMPN